MSSSPSLKKKSVVRKSDPIDNKIENVRYSDKKYEYPCTNCQKKKKKFNIKTLRMFPDGRVEVGDDVDFGDDSLAGGASMGSLSTSMETLALQGVQVKSLPKAIRTAKLVLEKIRKFSEERKGTVDNPRGMGEFEGERKNFMKIAENICENAKEVIGKETRVVKVFSPAYVFGDLHGNIEDLLTFESIFWKSVLTVGMTVPSFLFLGDFVDRGKWSVETALYLFCLKIIAPNKFFLVRGNHELSCISETYNFLEECVGKYGQEMGGQMFTMLNDVFDSLPLAAVIDDAIFCCHGGIPSVNWTLLDMQEITKDLELPRNENERTSNEQRAAWELLWNDPDDSSPYNPDEGITRWDQVDPRDMFEENGKRGTGKYFNEAAVDRFLEINGLTHIIRAHEMQDPGYKLHWGGKVITVFSCSHYNKPNKAACLLVDDESLRIIQIDTSKNKPAMDNDAKRYK